MFFNSSWTEKRFFPPNLSWQKNSTDCQACPLVCSCCPASSSCLPAGLWLRWRTCSGRAGEPCVLLWPSSAFLPAILWPCWSLLLSSRRFRVAVNATVMQRLISSSDVLMTYIKCPFVSARDTNYCFLTRFLSTPPPTQTLPPTWANKQNVETVWALCWRNLTCFTR